MLRKVIFHTVIIFLIFFIAPINFIAFLPVGWMLMLILSNYNWLIGVYIIVVAIELYFYSRFLKNTKYKEVFVEKEPTPKPSFIRKTTMKELCNPHLLEKEEEVAIKKEEKKEEKTKLNEEIKIVKTEENHILERILIFCVAVALIFIIIFLGYWILKILFWIVISILGIIGLFIYFLISYFPWSLLIFLFI